MVIVGCPWLLRVVDGRSGCCILSMVVVVADGY